MFDKLSSRLAAVVDGLPRASLALLQQLLLRVLDGAKARAHRARLLDQLGLAEARPLRAVGGRGAGQQAAGGAHGRERVVAQGLLLHRARCLSVSRARKTRRAAGAGARALG